MTLYKKGSRGEIVKQIQKAPDGIVGPATLAKLIPVRIKKSKRAITEIIIHCTATPEGKDYTIDDVRRWHKDRGFSDVGYHYVIGRHGEVWEGRDVDIQGAHCAAGGHNRNSIGVCYVGGISALNGKAKDTRTLAQKASMLNLLNELLETYPNAKIYGHHDFERNKDCPCFDAKTEYRLL